MDNTERDGLAKTIAAVQNVPFAGTRQTKIANAAIAYLRPTVTTVEEIDELPAGTVLRSENGGVWERALDGPGAVWRQAGSREKWFSDSIGLFATVLFRP